MSKPRHKFRKDAKSFSPAKPHESLPLPTHSMMNHMAGVGMNGNMAGMGGMTMNPMAMNNMHNINGMPQMHGMNPMMNPMMNGMMNGMIPMGGVNSMGGNPMMMNTMNPNMGPNDYHNIYGNNFNNYYQYYQPQEFDPYQYPNYQYVQSPLNSQSPIASNGLMTGHPPGSVSSNLTPNKTPLHQSAPDKSVGDHQISPVTSVEDGHQKSINHDDGHQAPVTNQSTETPDVIVNDSAVATPTNKADKEILQDNQPPQESDINNIEKDQDHDDEGDQILHSPIFINTTYAEFKSQDFNYRLKSFNNRTYNQDKPVVVNQFNYNIINYDDQVTDGHENTPSNSIPPPTNWASVLTKTVKPPTKVKPPTVKPAIIEPPITKEDEIENVGKLSLKLMFDESYSILKSNEVFKVSPRGLTNTGNICYMNSILQILIYCEPFNKLIRLMSKTTKSLKNSSTPLIDSIISLFEDFNSGNLKSLSPEPFYRNLTSLKKFQHLKWGQQEDAEEFLGYLLDGLHEEFIKNIQLLSNEEINKLLNNYHGETNLKLQQAVKIIYHGFSKEQNEVPEKNDHYNNNEWNEVGKKNEMSLKRTVEIEPSPIKTIFGGTFRSVLKIAKNQSITVDPYQCIQLDIKDDNITTIEEAFKHLNESETIHMNNNEVAKKQTFIDTLPPILVIHLKRFSFLNDGNVEKILKKIKYDHKLTIPIELFKKNSFVNNNYQLTGVVYHHGVSAEGGHYTVDVLKKAKLSNPLVNNNGNISPSASNLSNSSGNNSNNLNYSSNGNLNSSTINSNNNNNGTNFMNDEWIRIDDTLVSKIDREEVLKGDDDIKNAYILFYQQL